MIDITTATNNQLDALIPENDDKQGEIMLEATTFRFDGSDLMPGAIGAGLLEGAALFDEAEDFGVGEEEEGDPSP